MHTPRGLAEVLLDISQRAIGKGKGDENAGLQVLDVRALCLGIKWLCDGTYEWMSDEEWEALHQKAESLRGTPLPEGMTSTPEDDALALLDRFKAMKVDDNSGLTHRQVEGLCIAVGQLVSATYPYPFSEGAWAVREGAIHDGVPAP
jgi:hypothetical protein